MFPSGSWNERLWVSLWFGLAVLLVSYLVDRRTREDYAFWGYLFGMLAFWGGLSLMESGSEFRRFLYCLINVGLILLSVVLERRVFIVFGALGVFGYLGHLADSIFKDSLMFPFALTLLGIAIIYLGIKYQRNRTLIESAILGLVPGLRGAGPQVRLAEGHHGESENVRLYDDLEAVLLDEEAAVQRLGERISNRFY